jgi:Membrane proteins related to metalloendopeptidases
MLPIDAGPPADTDQPEDSTAPDEEFSAADELTSDEPATSNSALSHERESFLSHEPHGRLQHNRVPTAPVKPPRRKPVTLDGVAYVPVDGKQTDPNVIRDTAASVNTNDQAPGDSDGTETGTTPDVPAGTTADASAADTPAPGFDADSQSGGETVDDGGSEPDTDNPTPDNHAHGGSGGKKKNSKLNFDDETTAPETEKSGKKLEKAKHKAERSSGKLQTAKENIPKKRTLRMNKEFDAETGKMTKRLQFEKEVKTQREHLKGPLITRPVKAGAGAVVGYAHSKMYQVEEDNVGVKAAHRGESLAEGGLRTAYRRHKTAPYRKVQKLERKTAKLNAKASYQQALQDNPELKKKHLSRMMQKRRINREYAKMARESKRAGEAVKKTAVTTEKIAAKVVSTVKSHPVVFGVIALLLLIVIIVFGLLSSCSNMASGIGAAVGVMSYTADDASVDGAELYYTELETDLRLAALNAETDHGGFDEYRYSIDAVGHDPFMLMAYLTAVYQNFDLADIRAVLNDVFNEQYQLTFTPSMEIRYRTETHTSSYTDPETGETTESDYDVEVPYEWHILTVTLTSQPLFGVVSPRMNDDQALQYGLLMQSKGLRQYVSSPFAIDWLPYVSSYYGYRVHPISGVKDYHMGIDIALPTGTEILAAHAGTVTFAGVLGGYGNVVVIEDGGGLETKYAHCDTLLVSTGQIVAEGYVVATVGNTGSSTGPHLHFEVIWDGQYLNPIYFAQSGN